MPEREDTSSPTGMIAFGVFFLVAALLWVFVFPGDNRRTPEAVGVPGLIVCGLILIGGGLRRRAKRSRDHG